MQIVECLAGAARTCMHAGFCIRKLLAVMSTKRVAYTLTKATNMHDLNEHFQCHTNLLLGWQQHQGLQFIRRPVLEKETRTAAWSRSTLKWITSQETLAAGSWSIMHIDLPVRPSAPYEQNDEQNLALSCVWEHLFAFLQLVWLMAS